MIGSEVLLTSAEISLALCGFGSVVAAFSGDRKQWEAMEVVRFRALIVITLTAALVALIPFLLFYAGIEAAEMWALASTVVAVLSSGLLIGMLVYARVPMVTHGSRIWSFIAISIASLVVLVNVLNVLSIGFRSSFTGYFSGLLFMLILAGLYFIRLIILSGPQARGRQAPPASDRKLPP